MSSKGVKGGKKSVHFVKSKEPQNDNLAPTQKQSEQRPKKRPRTERPNEDEDDDVDEWVKEEEENDNIPSDRYLVDAKRNRRLKRQGRDTGNEFDEDTHDAGTSLMSEMKDGKNDIKIEPFNMKAESSDGTGYFEGDTYVFRRGDKEDESDAWLDSLNETVSNPDSHFRRVKVPKIPPENNENLDDWPKEDLYAKIVRLMSNSETVLGALVRYGDLIKRAGKKETKSSESSIKISQSSLNDLTTISNALLLQGDVDIYQKTREDIFKLVDSSKLSAKQAALKNAPNSVEWEYKGNEDGKVHGPYSSQEMLNWIRAGYFVGSQAVQVRMIKNSDGSTQPPGASIKEELLSDLMDDDDDDDKDNTNKVPGREWILSDKMDFKAYLP